MVHLGRPSASQLTDPMRLFQIKAFMAVSAWNLALNAAYQTINNESSLNSSLCYGQTETVEMLWSRLSRNSKIYCPQSPEFDRATARWSALEAPKVNIVVVPSTEKDVAETVSLPFPFELAVHLMKPG